MTRRRISAFFLGTRTPVPVTASDSHFYATPPPECLYRDSHYFKNVPIAFHISHQSSSLIPTMELDLSSVGIAWNIKQPRQFHHPPPILFDANAELLCRFLFKTRHDPQSTRP
ncbi:hypothetical protein BDN70DRAFT_938452 [Pholiota conissans]|uniref:Uncharacterized protein n=1 Tax=Pholiota conissans TaxID=109636 RepID=A0A9P5YNH2_9AGAR|nr:hypothetical protein BDN70DRAFT_938452 [Pholiota conissans]